VCPEAYPERRETVIEYGYAAGECNRGAGMGLKKLADKVAEYNERLAAGKVEKIKPDHVKQVQKKLQKKTAELEAEIGATESQDKKVRLKRKLAIAREQAERAEWLLEKIK
jgi:hypothetical protein